MISIWKSPDHRGFFVYRLLYHQVTYHGSNSFKSHDTVDVLCAEEQIHRDTQGLDYLVRDPVTHARGLSVEAQVDRDGFQVLGRQALLAHELVTHRERVRLVQEHFRDVVLDLLGDPAHIWLGGAGAKEGEGADLVVVRLLK